MTAFPAGPGRPADRARRVGDTVRRPTAFWSPAVHDLLRHLERVGFPASRLLAAGAGQETLSWLPGESGPAGWAKIVPEPGLRRWARFLRRYHDAVAGYRPPPASRWSSGPGTCAAGEIICHGDFGPWNGVWRGDDPVGLIDFDQARPASPWFDIAYALEYAAPFRDDRECTDWLRYPEPPDRRRRIEIFCAAYGVGVPDGIVGQVAAQQRFVLDRCADLARRGIEPQATWVRDGYLDTVRARIRWTEALRL
ncbi:MAG: phosphotransferase [Actinobacteria bacterium]|nr:phosphotransferase [Actinomycetota bacterium]